MTEIKAIRSPGKFKPAVELLSAAMRAGDVLYISGQTARNPDTGEVGKGDIEEQTNKVIDNIEAILRSQGLGLERVVRCTVFVTSAAELEGMNKAYLQRFKEPRPARSAYVVSGFASPALRVEIDAIAVYGSGPATY